MSSKISSGGSSQNRMDIKNYYRRSAGFMSFMSGIFMLAVVAIAFYIAENFAVIANSAADSDNGIASLYYIVVFFGLFAAVFNIAVGISGMRRDKDENFLTQRVSAVIGAVLYVIYIIGAVMSFTGEEYSINDDEYIAYYLIGAGVSAAGIIYSIAVFIMTTKALKYCDGKKGKAAEPPADMTIEVMDKRRTAVMLSGYGLITLSIWLLCWYFERQIVSFENNIAVDCGADAMIFMAIKYLGLLGTAYIAVCMLMNIRNVKAAYIMSKQALIYNTVVIVAALIFCILTTGKVYVKSGYPANEYYIFTYVLGAFAACICYVIYNHIHRQKMMTTE